VDDEIVVPSDTSLELAGSITVAAWVRPDAVPPQRPYGTHSHILSKSNNDYYGGGLNYELDYTRDPDNPGQGWFAFTGGVIGTCYSSVSFPIETWYHVVGVYDAQDEQQRVYVNGGMSASCSTGGKTLITPNDAPLVIGYGEVAAHFFHFEGAIDEVRVYNRAIGDSEIMDLYDGACGN
jgi:hypothetical protein